MTAHAGKIQKKMFDGVLVIKTKTSVLSNEYINFAQIKSSCNLALLKLCEKIRKRTKKMHYLFSDPPFLVQSFFADGYVHRTVLCLISLESPSSVERIFFFGNLYFPRGYRILNFDIIQLLSVVLIAVYFSYFLSILH